MRSLEAGLIETLQWFEAYRPTPNRSASLSSRF
jgi:hypothetical protein